MSNPYEYGDRPVHLGPVVWCDDVEEYADTESPFPDGPWRCSNCRSTEHREIV